eukprot:CAMPEP_0179861698 /NCGR_PEP_ID=MMETSP0982-20121206/14407_1 /TAXON_ID=483367 /ORGANISM="non described non described, Strain CCMP 2436" /LENGTH=240 /DNA_ID=CAMNT_0021749271 /DNA_START=208 /DNA_END=931 /DNA_ORIENTATION=+
MCWVSDQVHDGSLGVDAKLLLHLEVRLRDLRRSRVDGGHLLPALRLEEDHRLPAVVRLRPRHDGEVAVLVAQHLLRKLEERGGEQLALELLRCGDAAQLEDVLKDPLARVAHECRGEVSAAAHALAGLREGAKVAGRDEIVLRQGVELRVPRKVEPRDLGLRCVAHRDGIAVDRDFGGIAAQREYDMRTATTEAVRHALAPADAGENRLERVLVEGHRVGQRAAGAGEERQWGGTAAAHL